MSTIHSQPFQHNTRGDAGLDVPAGLAGVTVATTAVGDVRGEEGFYQYRGLPAPELAYRATFEAVWHLLIVGHLPDAEELAAFRSTTSGLRALPAQLRDALPLLAASGSPMSALRSGLSLAGGGAQPWLDLHPEQRRTDVQRLVALAPTLAAAVWRTSQGLAPIEPDPTLGIAADYLRMTTGTPPSSAHATAMERYLILTVDHGLNASTFAARVVTSTGADLPGALVAGLAALAGPLHGGAPSLVLRMLQEIGSVDAVRPWVEQALASNRRIMGFGHRVYRTEDPRSVVLKETARQLGGPLVDLAVEVERVVLEVLARRYPKRDLRTNVEFYAGVVLHLIGLPPEMFTPSFAVSRLVGWAAHVLEQTEANQLIRPLSRYRSDDGGVGASR
ncbi:MAG: citrate/2-methylcitrate synthase [Acidimicrobiales bacterium]